LAAADEQEVLRLWEGLGYYRRATDLHRAARQVIAEHGGQVPDDPARFAQLPGIGPYLKGAVLSQAFDRRLPIIEANSIRVLCRFFGQEADPRAAATRRWLWETAESLLPRRRAGEFNQAMMELGALLCTVKSPRCDNCPLRPDCAAYRLGRQQTIPAAAQRPAPVQVREALGVVRRGDRVLLAQRPAGGRWAGLWEFPHGPLEAGETPEAAAVRIIAALAGLRTGALSELLTIRHSVTRFRIEMICFEARHHGGSFSSPFYPQARWLTPAQLSSWPLSRPQRILADHLACGTSQKVLF
jgi:A/G-specific adenine glycosylase